MNQIAIFNLLAIFCFSFAPAKAQFEDRIKIIKATIDDDVESQTLSQGNLYLNKTVDLATKTTNYWIENNVKILSSNFSILQRNTVVTKNKIIVRWALRNFTLTLDEDHFEFYQKLFSQHFGRYQFTYPLDAASVGNNTLQNESGLRLRWRKGERDEWVVVALDGYIPRLIFPRCFVEKESPTFKDDYDLVLTFTLKTKIKIPIAVEFKESTAGRAFYSFLKGAYV